ncbi:MAG TPA: phosphotransferase [Actinomycetota bacterium]|nr:phosphotransferase [Actinomycetota bacterium]
MTAVREPTRSPTTAKSVPPRPAGTLVRQVVAPSVAALVGSGTRSPMVPEDSYSGARFEWVVIGGVRHVLKYQDLRDDIFMRATGDVGHRYVALWESGVLDALPEVIDHATVGCALEGRVGAILMRDVGDRLLPPGDIVFPMDQHRRFLAHMAALHAAFWGFRDTVGLTPLANRYVFFTPAMAGLEARRGGVLPPILEMTVKGWAAFRGLAPELAGVIAALHTDATPLLDALAALPHTLVHGDWKAGNLGEQPDGRTVLLDWGELPGEASPLADLAWYLSINAARLPESKLDTAAAYRQELERCGVATAPWWEDAFAVEMLATTMQLGWNKALGDQAEMDWWRHWAGRGARCLGLA